LPFSVWNFLSALSSTILVRLVCERFKLYLLISPLRCWCFDLSLIGQRYLRSPAFFLVPKKSVVTTFLQSPAAPRLKFLFSRILVSVVALQPSPRLPRFLRPRSTIFFFYDRVAGKKFVPRCFFQTFTSPFSASPFDMDEPRNPNVVWKYSVHLCLALVPLRAVIFSGIRFFSYLILC